MIAFYPIKYLIVTIKKFALKTILFIVGLVQTLRAQCIITRLFKYLIYLEDLDRILPRQESFYTLFY